MLAVSVVFNVAFLIAALTGPDSPAGMVEKSEESPSPQVGPVLHQSLDLTPEQKERFAKRRREVAAQVATLRQQVRGAREQLWWMVADNAPDTDRLEAQIERISAIQNQVQGLVVKHMLWMRKQLTADQQKMFDGFVETRMCSCPKCDGGCLGGCPGKCSEVDSARPKDHSDLECGCGQ